MSSPTDHVPPLGLAVGEIVVAGLVLPAGGDGSMTRRLTTALRTGIQDGSLIAGQALPPSRQLSAEIGCSRWVITEAYGQLVAEGYLSAATGSATRVRRVSGSVVGPATRAPVIPPRPRYDLQPGMPDLAAFPRTRWAEAYRRAVLGLPTDVLAGRSLVASTTARATVADYLRRTRQVQEDPTQLSLTTGTTVGASWLFRVLAALGHRRVAVENPSWPAVREAARRAGLDPVPIEVDTDGIVVSRLADHPGVRAAVVTPAHQFPCGVALSARRRLELIDWAEQVDGLIVEDDYDAEFRYDRRTTASLQGMAPDRVAMLGSLSKTLSPAVELGWLIMPQQLIKAMLPLDLDRIVGPSPFTVEALAIMISSGTYERHIRGQLVRYRRRRTALIEALAAELPDCVVSGLPAGLHLLLGLPDHADAAEVVRRAARLDVGVVDVARYRVEIPSGAVPGPGPALVLGFGNLRSGQERHAVALLADAVRAEG